MSTQANKPLTVVATITVKPEHVEQIKSELLKLTAASQTDQGCIQYTLHQDNANSHVFIVYEIWENKERLQEHAESPHFQHYVKVSEGMVDEFVITEMTAL